MRFIRCDMSHFEAVASMYERCVKKLEETINFPKWSKDHPSLEYIREAIGRGGQFAAVEGGKVLGAVVLSEDPEGNYGLGDWKNDLAEGEFLVIHTLAVDPAFERRGVGGFLVDGSVAFAKENGYKAVRLDIVPENVPAKNLYLSKGFSSAGKRSGVREIEYIPLFELFELNF